MFAKFSEKLTFLYPLIHTRTCAYQGVRNVSFSENFANVIDEWSHTENIETKPGKIYSFIFCEMG